MVGTPASSPYSDPAPAGSRHSLKSPGLAVVVVTSNVISVSAVTVFSARVGGVPVTVGATVPVHVSPTSANASVSPVLSPVPVSVSSAGISAGCTGSAVGATLAAATTFRSPAFAVSNS